MSQSLTSSHAVMHGPSNDTAPTPSVTPARFITGADLRGDDQ